MNRLRTLPVAALLCLVAAPLAAALEGAAAAPTPGATHAQHAHDAPDAPDPHAGHGAEVPPRQLYTCGMHPQVIRDQPGKCPICGMELTPIDPGSPPGKTADGSGAITIDPAIVQNMGVRTATVAEGPLRRTVRANGILAEAQPKQHDVNLRVSGWIQRLYADVEGMHVRAGEPLFDLYSPELQVAIGELIAARRGGDGHGSQAVLARAAAEKLELLGLPRSEIERIGRLEQPPATVTFTSPISGHVIEKPIVAGDAVQAGMRALRIVDHSELWIDARVFEQDLPALRLGQPARATLTGLPGQAIDGTIDFIHPHVDPATRTTTARLTVRNPSLALRPGMYATVEIDSEIAPRALLAPRDAVIDTGTEQIVFLSRPGGQFEPRRVVLGPTGSDGRVQILSGLALGDLVVTSGQFLLDAESNMREALQRFLTAPGHVH